MATLYIIVTGWIYEKRAAEEDSTTKPVFTHPALIARVEIFFGRGIFEADFVFDLFTFASLFFDCLLDSLCFFLYKKSANQKKIDHIVHILRVSKTKSFIFTNE